MESRHTIPTVLCFSGLDPTGGAGIQADIETLASHGCHAIPIITCNTVQDTRDVIRVVPTDATLVIEQARAILEDISVAAVKIGLLADTTMIEAIHTLLRDYPDIPVVLDPVLSSGGSGAELSPAEVRTALQTLLIPLTTIITPNSNEARALAPEADTLSACAMQLLDQGCEFVLITGAHENTDKVINSLYGNNRKLEEFAWERLPDTYHGSGCTLASSIAGLLAQGIEPMSTILEAQQYTWESLKQGYRIGMGQLIPNRLFWAQNQ